MANADWWESGARAPGSNGHLLASGGARRAYQQVREQHRVTATPHFWSVSTITTVFFVAFPGPVEDRLLHPLLSRVVAQHVCSGLAVSTLFFPGCFG